MQPQSLAQTLIAVAALVSHHEAAADAIQKYTHAGDKPLEVRAGLGITTQIELDRTEKVLDFSTGFSNGWSLSRRENVFYIRPKDVDVDTNMMIRTELRTYILELKVVATDWKSLDQAKKRGVHYRVTIHPPVSENSASLEMTDISKSPDSGELSTTLIKERNYNFNYDYSTHERTYRWLIPVNVYDDGKFTYLRMGRVAAATSSDFPAVFMRERAHGEDAIVNTTVSGETIVVHGTHPYLVLRHGKKVVGIRRNTPK